MSQSLIGKIKEFFKPRQIVFKKPEPQFRIREGIHQHGVFSRPNVSRPNVPPKAQPKYSSFEGRFKKKMIELDEKMERLNKKMEEEE